MKHVLLLCFLGGALGFTVSIVHSQSYPTKPIRLVVPYPPGGGTDIIARIVGQKLNENLGQQIIVDNRGGMIYLNAVSFAADSVGGVDRVVLPPGEPYDDMDHDGARDGLETYVNLMYGTTIGSGAVTDDIVKQSVATQNGSATSPDGERYGVATTLQRDARGLPGLAAVNLFGVLYNSGDIVAEGSMVVYGSLAAGDDVIQVSSSAPTPVIYFDDRLNTGEWPPPEIAMPRTFISFWQTSRP